MKEKWLLGIGCFVIMCIVSVFYMKQMSCSLPDANQNFVVGTAAGYAPFVSVNANGDYEGFDIDVAQAVAQRIGKKLVIKDLGSMTALFMALERGMIDAIIWGLSITQDRLEKVAMIHYQGEPAKSYPLIFWNAIPEGIQSINDLKGKTVCVEPTSSQEAVLRKYSFIKQFPIEKVDDALLLLQYGKVDAAFVEPAIANKFKRQYPNIQILDVPLAPEDQVQGVGIAVKKNNDELIKDIQKAVTRLKSQGRINQFQMAWGIE